MTVGPWVKKLTYLIGPIDLTGKVEDWNSQSLGVAGDGFALRVDDNFAHLPNYTASNDVVHCETYPFTDLSQINYVAPWPLAAKPQENFRVRVPSTGEVRDLNIGDHIRISGHLAIENGHPQNRSKRGWLEIGYIFLELHPFDWTRLELVEPLAVDTVARGSVILAAPLYEMVYTPYYDAEWSDWGPVANQLAGVDSHLFFEDDGRHLHNSVTATVRVDASPPPAGVAPATQAVQYVETVTVNGTGQALDQLRSISHYPGGIQIDAHVDAPIAQDFGPVPAADVNDPAHGHSVLVLNYAVCWEIRIGRLGHSIRRADGTWTGVGDVNGQFAIPGPVRAVAATSSAPNEAQFLFATEDGHLWHTVRRPDGSWSGLGDVNGQFAIPGPVRTVAAASSAPGEAQFLFATEDGYLWHTVRRPDGSWSGLGDVSGQFAIPGPVSAVAATSSAAHQAQFLFATEDGRLWHTIRRPDGGWSGLGDVNGQFAIPGPVQAVAATSSAPDEAQFLFTYG
jgi:hypothetical protein